MALPRQASGTRSAFNLVEIMVTLTMVALLTSTLISFVNDYDDKSKAVRAKNDLMQLSQAAQMWEARSGHSLTTASMAGNSEVPQELVEYLVELPPHDPWGRRFVVDSAGNTFPSSDVGMPYVLDASFGRFICAGPDGLINTRLGRGASDNDNDIVVEFRQQPWLAYCMGDEIWTARADGTRLARVYKGATNITFSPDGTRWAGVQGSDLVFGNTSAENAAVRIATDPSGLGVTVNLLNPNVTYPFFFPDGNNVGFIDQGGSLRVSDFNSKSTAQLVPPQYLDLDVAYSPSDTEGRIIHVSNERSYYWKVIGVDNSIGIAVAADGKIAYGAYGPLVPVGTEGIHVVLPGGTGDRLLKKRNLATDNWYPMFWIDSGAVAYYSDDGSSVQRLRRINQDGRFDIPLYDNVAYGLGPKSPICPTISPQGDRMGVFHNDSGPGGWTGKVLRTDGGGFAKGQPSFSEFVVPTPTLFQEGIWSPMFDCFYVGTEDTGSAGLWQVDLKSAQPPAVAIGAGTVPNLYNTYAIPGAMKLNTGGTLMAVITHPSKTGPGSINGVYVYPILGPTGAVITITTTAPPDAHVAITWVSE